MKMIPITQGCPPGDLDCAGWYEGGHWDENGHWVITPVTNIEGQEFNGYIDNKHIYLLSKQFKINKFCYNYSTDKDCEKLTNHLFGFSRATFITNDGVIWGIHDTYHFSADINGFTGPNKYGRDQFVFEITNQLDESRYGIPQGTVVPRGSKLHADIYNYPNYYWRNNNYCTTENVNRNNADWWSEGFCTGRVLEEDAMNY